jgi:transposase
VQQDAPRNFTGRNHPPQFGIVKRSDPGFKVLPKPWVVEQTFTRLGRCRRFAKDFDCLMRNVLAFLRWASVRLLLRNLCNPA